MSSRDKEYIEKLEKYVIEAKIRVKYSLERFDILVISLSSGGLALGLSLYSQFPLCNKTLISLSWLFFSVALMSNLISQLTGYMSNKKDIECTNLIIETAKGAVPDEEKEEKIELSKKKYNKATKVFNSISFLSLCIAIILLIIFVNIKI